MFWATLYTGTAVTMCVGGWITRVRVAGYPDHRRVSELALFGSTFECLMLQEKD